MDNIVMLCTACHHRIHTQGWDIVVKDNVVYFTVSTSSTQAPPASTRGELPAEVVDRRYP